MNMKEEALKLANEFDEMTDPFQSLAYAHKAQAMIRRLVEELEFQKKANIDLLLKNTYSNRTIELLQQDTPQTKPLSDEEITEIYKDYWLEEHGQIVDFVKAIEERHGIK